MTKEFLQDLISFTQQKGFVWGPTPEIYGGSAGFYTYAPLGKLLKNNIENTVRSVFYEHEFGEVECPTIMPSAVWEASGHLGTFFTDPMVSCAKCKSSFKAETLIEEQFAGTPAVSDFEKFFTDNIVACPSCKARMPAVVKAHNLMMKTQLGLDTEAYNRPETATTTYLEFLRYHDFYRKKLPFGIFQIGNAYRNEISPRQHLLRTREFTQAEGQIFIFDHQKKDYPKFDEVKADSLPFFPWSQQEKKGNVIPMSLADAMKNKVLKNKAYAYTLWLTFEIFKRVGIPLDRMRMTQHSPKDMAFYAEDAWDIEVNLNSFGWTEVCGVHDRTDYDLTQHGIHSKTNFAVLDEETGDKKIPHILEIAFGTGRLTFAILDLFYDKKQDGDGKSVFRVPNQIAPYKVAVYPLVKKEAVALPAKKLYKDLSKDFMVKYDERGSIGKRYLRASEAGIPYVVTVDFDGLEDDTVTIRHRDTEEQERVKVSELKDKLKSLLN